MIFFLLTLNWVVIFLNKDIKESHYTVEAGSTFNFQQTKRNPILKMEGLCGNCSVFLCSHEFEVDYVSVTKKLSLFMSGGCTPPMYSAFQDHSQCVETLIKAGADVNKNEGAEYLLLTFSARAGDCRSVQLLLEARPDVNDTDDDRGNGTAICTASRIGHNKQEEISTNQEEM